MVKFKGKSGLADDCPALEFLIYFSTAEWNALNPHEKTYANDKRTYIQFDKSWTTVFNSKIWEAAQLPCKWRFCHHHFHTRKNCVPFTFEAICAHKKISSKQCLNYMYGKCYEIPSQGVV